MYNGTTEVDTVIPCTEGLYYIVAIDLYLNQPSFQVATVLLKAGVDSVELFTAKWKEVIWIRLIRRQVVDIHDSVQCFLRLCCTITYH